MKNLSSPLFIILCLILIPSITTAAKPLDVKINEIAWMGTNNSVNDEWMELYNNTENPINLEGWQLVSQDGTPKITLSGVISASGFYLLERTNDDTVPGISADKIYSGALGNSGENLKLYDNLNNVIDEVNCSEKWLAGDNTTKQTMERKIDNNWQTSQNPGGTPKSQNSTGAVAKIELPPKENNKQGTAAEENQKTETGSTEIVKYPDGIILNEILPSPEGADEKEEWIEIFNPNNSDVDLSEWRISDNVGKTTTFTFPAGTKITPNGFLVLSRPDTKITLNNDGDGLNLIQPDGKIIDSVTYEKAPRGQSYNRINSDWTWSTTLSPGSANIIPAPVSETKEAEPPQKVVKEPAFKDETEKKRELAAVGEQIPKETSFVPFLIALTIAIFSGIIILILKKQVKKVYNKKV